MAENKWRKKLLAKIFGSLDTQLFGFSKRRRHYDVEKFARLIATYDSAQFFMGEMRLASNLVTRDKLLDFALSEASVDGLTLEFGVAQGESIRQIAGQISGKVYGFDSFEGLPEDWTHFQRQGRFGDEGAPSGLPANVELVAGWFNETLPPFLEGHPGDARFIHVDSDIYSSAKTVLACMAPRIVAGTVILFDEYFNYPGWQHHEHKAFGEFVEEHQVEFEYLGFASSQCSVGVRITKPPQVAD